MLDSQLAFILSLSDSDVSSATPRTVALEMVGVSLLKLAIITDALLSDPATSRSCCDVSLKNWLVLGCTRGSARAEKEPPYEFELAVCRLEEEASAPYLIPVYSLLRDSSDVLW